MAVLMSNQEMAEGLARAFSEYQVEALLDVLALVKCEEFKC
jgi:hypothetical protein